jgi:hypothetical protein
MVGFAKRFGLLTGERGLAAMNMLINSVIVARLLDSHAAAAYFFFASAAQIIMSPWIPGGEIAWLHRGARERFLPQLVNTVSCAIAIGSAVTMVVGVAAGPAIGGSAVIVGACIGSYLFYPSILLLLPSKFGDTGRFILAASLGNIFGIAVKLVVALTHASQAWASIALFADSFAIAALAVLLSRRLPIAPRQGLLRPEEFRSLAMAAGSVVVVLLSWRLVMLLAAKRLGSTDYSAFGLAFQLINSTSFVAAALTGTTAYALRSHADRKGKVKVIAVSASAALAMTLMAYGCLRLGGPTILGFLLGLRGQMTSMLVSAGILVVLSILLQAIGSALAATSGKVPLFTLCTLGTAAVSTAAFLVGQGSLENRVFVWSVAHLISSVLGLGLVGRSVRLDPVDKPPVLGVVPER